MAPKDLPPDELAVTAKALDVHRQALIRKLDRVGNNSAEKQRTMEEIQSCSNAAARFRREHDTQLAQQLRAS